VGLAATDQSLLCDGPQNSQKSVSRTISALPESAHLPGRRAFLTSGLPVGPSIDPRAAAFIIWANVRIVDSQAIHGRIF